VTIIDFPVRAEAVTAVAAPVAVPRPRRARRVSTSVGLSLFALLLVQAWGAALAVRLAELPDAEAARLLRAAKPLRTLADHLATRA